MNRHLVKSGSTVAAALLLASLAVTAQAISQSDSGGWLQLITPQEANMRDAAVRLLSNERRSGEPGPDIEVISPEPDHNHTVPVPIKIIFRPREGTVVDLSTLSVVYVKWIDIDITDRLRKYVTETGIDVPEAALPPGRHTIQISIGDSAGHTTEKQFTVRLREGPERLGRW